MSKLIKLILNRIGSFLALIGIGFVGVRLQLYIEQLSSNTLLANDYVAIGVLILLYGVGNIFLVFAWRCLLRPFGVVIKFRRALRIYGVSQMAKYLPGNILHLSGRQAMGMASGVEGWALAKATLWELGLIAFAGMLFGWLALPLLWPTAKETFSLVGFLGCLILAGIIAKFSLNSAVFWALNWQVLYLFAFGGISASALYLILPNGFLEERFWVYIGAFVLAWLAGFAMPGVPAGAGVRELVIFLLLGNQVAEPDLLLAVILGRAIAIIGDLLFFLVAYLTPLKKI